MSTIQSKFLVISTNNQKKWLTFFWNLLNSCGKLAVLLFQEKYLILQLASLVPSCKIIA